MRATSAKPIPRIDRPVAGFYRTKLVKGGVWVAVRIWFDYPPDPDQPGQLLDRSPRWQATVSGSFVDTSWDVWPGVSGQPIDEAEYRYLIDLVKWSGKYAPGHPSAQIEKPIDLNSLKPIF